METVLIGKKVAHYEIVDIVGKGGMGVVFKAIDRNLDREVALKLMDSRLSKDEEFLKRFRIEAVSQAKLKHENIVDIYAMAEADVGLYIVMEYVAGEDLAVRIRREGALDTADAVQLTIQIGKALAYAHTKGIIHRDIKPSNAVIEQVRSHVKVTDFGLAQHKDMRLTATASSGGTMIYASPEQLKSLKSADTRSDIYSLGMTFYEMLAGKLPFEGDSVLSVQQSILQGKIPPPNELNPNIPPELVNITLKAIAREPEKRYSAARDMLGELERFAERSSWTRRKSTSGGDVVPKPSRMPLVLGVAAALVLVAALFAFNPDWLGRFTGAGESAVHVTLYSIPSGAAVTVDGVRAGITPLTFQFTPDERPEEAVKVTMALEGYIPLDTSLNLAGPEAQAVTIRLQRPSNEIAEAGAARDEAPAGTAGLEPAPGRLNVTSSPTGAAIHVAGLELPAGATTPFLIDSIPVGEYPVTLKLDGYTERSRTATIAAGKRSAIHLTLQPLTASIRITSVPPGARIWIDGALVEDSLTPATLAGLSLEPHSVRLEKDHYATLTQSVTPQPEQTTEFHAVLTENPGTLSILMLPYATLHINGQLVGRDLHREQSIALSPGVHQVRAIHPVFGEWEETVTISAGGQRDLTIDFDRFVALTVTAFDGEGNPVIADIYVDGEFSGFSTPKKLNLRPGKHLIEVRREGYRISGGPRALNLAADLEAPLEFTLTDVRGN